MREVAAKPEWTVLTATAYASVGEVGVPTGSGAADLLIEPVPSSVPEVTIETIDIDFSRPHGKRFGTLVHAVLSVIAFDSSRKEIEAIARVQGRIFGATDRESAAAVVTVERTLSHPLLQRALAATRLGKCRREVPIALKLDDGSVLEGVVDLAFQEPEGHWIVIDYKTDFEVKGRLEEYQRQVSLYALAVFRATAQPTKAFLLRI
jgi:ATP-dependent exoDNAse (exonuclease V) beta subunit